MKTLVEALADSGFLHETPDYARGDCQRIQSAANLIDLQLSLSECFKIWQEWSDERSAQWLIAHDIQEIHQAIRSYIDKHTPKA